MSSRQLNLSQDTFHHLHKLADGKRGRVTFAKQDLVNLLMDYSIMRELLGPRVQEPRRERLHLNEAQNAD